MMRDMSASGRVLELAQELGFDVAGIAPLAPPKAASRFEEWLRAGRNADMRWLERDRDRKTRASAVAHQEP